MQCNCAVLLDTWYIFHNRNIVSKAIPICLQCVGKVYFILKVSNLFSGFFFAWHSRFNKTIHCCDSHVLFLSHGCCHSCSCPSKGEMEVNTPTPAPEPPLSCIYTKPSKGHHYPCSFCFHFSLFIVHNSSSQSYLVFDWEKSIKFHFYVVFGVNRGGLKFGFYSKSGLAW